VSQRQEGDALWLRFLSSSDAQSETLEFKIKRPLLAASAVFALGRALDNPKHYVIRSKIQAKIPLKGAWVFQSETRFDPDVQTGALFENSSEELEERGKKEWRNTGGRLEYFEDGQLHAEEGISYGESASDAGPILSASQLIFAFASSWRPKVPGFFGQLVAGKRLFAIRVLRKRENLYEVDLLDLDRPLELGEMKQLDWHGQESHHASFTWDAERKVISVLAFDLPLLGKIEMPLIQHSRV
jgi:hypothetical protein